jgi:hypothetical protein
MFGHIKSSEHSFFFIPSKQKCLGAFFDAEPINASDLNSQFVWIPWIAAVCHVPNVAEYGGSLVA